MLDRSYSGSNLQPKQVDFVPTPQFIPPPKELDDLNSDLSSTVQPRTERAFKSSKGSRYPFKHTDYVTPASGVRVQNSSIRRPRLAFARNDLCYPSTHAFNDFSCQNPKEKLDLSHWLVSDRVLEYISHTRTSLVSLDLSCADGFTSIGLRLVFSVKGLTECNLSHSVVFDDMTARALSQCGDSLTSLNLSHCTLTPTAMEIFANSFRQLQVLDLSSCGSLSDRMTCSIELLVRRHRKLRSINLAGCNHTSEDSLISLLQHGARFYTHLTFNSNVLVTDITMVPLRKRMASLRELHLADTQIGDNALTWYVKCVLFMVNSC